MNLSMPPYNYVVVGAWSIFIVWWEVSSLFAKRTIGRRQSLWLHWALVIAVVFLFARLSAAFRLPERAFIVTQPALGAMLTVAGITLAIWARIYLGRNWGMPAAHKESPELVTGGPYAYVRNPIYTGMILALLGSALASTVWWLVPCVFSGAYFVYSAKQEEAIMHEAFPGEYPVYRARTKRFVPFIW